MIIFWNYSFAHRFINKPVKGILSVLYKLEYYSTHSNGYLFSTIHSDNPFLNPTYHFSYSLNWLVSFRAESSFWNFCSSFLRSSCIILAFSHLKCIYSSLNDSHPNTLYCFTNFLTSLSSLSKCFKGYSSL